MENDAAACAAANSTLELYTYSYLEYKGKKELV
jgi:hypothetical protein